MIERRCIGALLRGPKHCPLSAGLRRSRLVVYSAIDPRKERAPCNRRPFRWSVPDAATVLASAEDRALYEEGRPLKLYHFWKPGQTWMCPRARKGASR
jgi:hypothetical protein